MQWLRLNKISIFYCLVKDSKCTSLCCCWQCVVAKMENYNDDQCNLVLLIYVKIPGVLLTVAFVLLSPTSTR